MSFPGNSWLTRPAVARFLPFACILFAWSLVNGYLIRTYGIVTDFGEPGKYVSEAQLFIRSGTLSSPSYWLYFTQIALLAAVIRLKTGFGLALLIQLLLNLLATIYFYKTLIFLFRRRTISIIGTIILLFNYPYQQFNVYLQTESLFYSLILIITYYVLTLERRDIKKTCLILLMLAILCITRPTGLLFIPPVFVYIFLVFSKNLGKIQKVALLAGAGIVFLFLLDKALGSGGGLDFMLPFRQGDIICDVPTLPADAPIKTAANGNSLYGLLYYIAHNSGQFARLAWLRSLAFFGLFREYYSARHNICLAVSFYTVDLLALAAIPFWIKNNPYRFFYFLTSILLIWITAILTCDDWHNRFYLSISPFLIILGAGSIARLLKKTPDA